LGNTLPISDGLGSAHLLGMSILPNAVMYKEILDGLYLGRGTAVLARVLLLLWLQGYSASYFQQNHKTERRASLRYTTYN